MFVDKDTCNRDCFKERKKFLTEEEDYRDQLKTTLTETAQDQKELLTLLRAQIDEQLTQLDQILEPAKRKEKYLEIQKDREKCNPGDLRKHEDGCNTCTCGDDEKWSCTEKSCYLNKCKEFTPPCKVDGDCRAGERCLSPKSDKPEMAITTVLELLV